MKLLLHLAKSRLKHFKGLLFSSPVNFVFFKYAVDLIVGLFCITGVIEQLSPLVGLPFILNQFETVAIYPEGTCDA